MFQHQAQFWAHKKHSQVHLLDTWLPGEGGTPSTHSPQSEAKSCPRHSSRLTPLVGVLPHPVNSICSTTSQPPTAPQPTTICLAEPQQLLPGLLPQGMSTCGLLSPVHSAARGSLLKQKVIPLLKTHHTVHAQSKDPYHGLALPACLPCGPPQSSGGPIQSPHCRCNTVCNTVTTIGVPCETLSPMNTGAGPEQRRFSRHFRHGWGSGKGDGQRDGDIGEKVASSKKGEKLLKVSILSHKDGHVAKILSFLKKNRVSEAPHHTVKIPLKGNIRVKLTLGEGLPFIHLLPHDPVSIRCHLSLPSLQEKVSRKIGNFSEFAKTLEIQ